MKKILLSLPVLFLLTSCVSLRVPTVQTHFTHQSAKTRRKTLSAIKNWSIDGALSISLKGQQPEIANYAWQQHNTNYHISLSSTLNLYRITINKQGNHLSLQKNGQSIAHATTAEGLMYRALGWALPVSQLQYWIKSMPAPHLPYQAQYDAYGHITVLKQAGNVIHYQRYQTLPNKVDVPQLLSLQNNRLFAKIVIKQFKVPA